MDRMIYDVTVKCPPQVKKGKQQVVCHASVREDGDFLLFDFEESHRYFQRLRFELKEGYTLEYSQGIAKLLSVWRDDEEGEKHPNLMHCKAEKVA